MENPEALSAPHIESANEALYVGFTFRIGARAMRRAHYDDVLSYHRRGLQTDLAIDQIDFLIVVQLQIHQAIFSEARDRHARFRIQRD